jgi:hypothetical protein
MVSQKQIAAILMLASAVVAVGFAVYNMYESFKPNSVGYKLQNLPQA